MATTGISALGNDQIIAIAALSSKSAATAEYTTGGGGLQGLYNTVNGNSATWTTVTSKLNSTAFSTVSGSFLTSHQSLPQSANWNSTYNTVHDNSGSWTGGGGGGVEYSGITPIVVNNTSHEISADTWGLAIGDGLSAVEDAVNKQTVISVTGGGATYTAGNMISLANDIVSFSSQAGITDIVSATALPATPVSTVLYLIPEA